MEMKIMKKRITGSLPVKIAVFILMILCVGIGMFAGYGTFIALSEDVYDTPSWQRLDDVFSRQARSDQYEIYYMFVNSERTYGPEGADKFLNRLIIDTGDGRVNDYCQGRNIRVEIFSEESDKAVWSNYDPEEGDGWSEAYVYGGNDFQPVSLFSSAMSVGEAQTEEILVEEADGGSYYEEEEPQEDITNKSIRIVLYLNRELPYRDEYYKLWQMENMLESYATTFPTVAGTAVFAVLICFIFLMCSAGHRNVSANDRVTDEGVMADGNRIYPGCLQGIWLDVLLAVLIAVLGLITSIASDMVGFAVIKEWIGFINSFWVIAIVLVIWAMLTAFFGTVFCMELAIRMKRGVMLQHTLVYTVLRLIGRGIRAFVRGVSAILCSFPVLVPSLAAFTALSACEFFGLMIWGSAELAVVWAFERVLILAAISYFGLVRGKLKKAGKALAEGNLSYHVDTSKMILGYKEHGNHLNSIGEGMAKAVAERMKSEHLKTELISNVSHDLKTPLTSIINYSDLLGQEGVEPEKVREYAEVLHRQSVRLKKLLDDLLEVSKASTGNLTTDPAPCDVKVLVAQTAGEYEQRFAERKLELIHEEPEQDVRIMADHRHLFRIFDNLLGNIYKYAQPGSRVYLNVEIEDKTVRIILRNMSEYPLNVNGGELMERFVRGDQSRHKEGNGLGLSIAMSLAQLQGGSLQIVTDGDLFKAVLEFPQQQE